MAFGGNGKKIAVIVVASVLVIGTLVGAILIYKSAASSSPVPQSISKQVDFPIYYPDQKQLSSGYTFDKTSITSPAAGVILYKVNYSGYKKIIITIQKLPSDTEIQNFYSNYIPLRTKMQTRLGEAQVGARNIQSNGKLITQTVVSLPTSEDTWILVTAPYDVNQGQLKQVLNSLKR
jgi:hypothetical protein